MSKIVWDRLDENEFNRTVEALLVAECTRDGLRAQAIDGRGGDGGIDVDVRVESTDQITQIFQLKYFPGGFSSVHVKRRTQIKKSFEAAMEHSPPVWTLVFPGNPTIGERKHLSTLKGNRKVIIRILGAAGLDVLLSKHPKIAAHLTRNEAVEVLREVNRAEAVLAKSGDLRAEVARLQHRLDGRSQYWGTAFSLEPSGSYVETVYAKRHDAQQREPLSITLRAEFGTGDDELRQKFDDKMKYGGSGTLILPDHVIKEFRRSGAEWFEETSHGGEVEIRDIDDHEPQTVKAELFDNQGRRLSQLSGATRTIDRGYGGGSIETSLHGGLDLRWRFSDKFDEGGSVTINFDPSGATVREVRQALRFVQKLQPEVQMHLTVAGNPAIKVTTNEAPTFGPDQALIELVDDLCFIEDKLDVVFRFPADGTDLTDRIWARVMVQMLEGKPVPYPFARSFTGTLSGERDEGLDVFLTQERAVVVSHDGWALELFGEVLQIGNVMVYSHHAKVDDVDAVLAAFDAGTAAGMEIAIRPVNDGPFLIYAPQYLSNDPDATVLAYPWGLTGVAEHPQLSSLPNYFFPVVEGPGSAETRAPIVA